MYFFLDFQIRQAYIVSIKVRQANRKFLSILENGGGGFEYKRDF